MVRSIQATELNYRLPNNTFPLRYNIELTTNIHNDTIGDDRFRFDGKVTIQLMAIGQPIENNITLNFRQINIKHVKLWHIQNGWEQILIDDGISFTLDQVREFVTVHSPQPLNGSYYLELQYNGTLREDNAGFYRSSYRTDDGSVRWLATTQFSSTDARHAFPCYDEPGIRAPIGLRVIHGKQYMALSNGIPIDMRESLLDGMIITTFADTPRMQSYLLGIVVSDFSEVSLPLYSRQTAFVRSNAISDGKADFIVEAGFKILAVLEEFLETPYILPKLYHVAVPDFAPGAMENYGLITYKEENFFYDRVSSPMKQLKTIATIVGHEVGHHFFGNYVSPAWWSFLWMKEGFARFFEYLAPQLVYPELDIDETYAVEKTQNVFEIDSTGNVRPMTFYVNTQNEIAGIFDDIAYDKGGAILRMFYHALGQNTFRRALVLYLHNNSLGAATPEQFAEAIQKAINEVSLPILYEFDAIELLKSWTEQAGYPSLFVLRTSNCSIQIHQEKYLLRANSSKSTESWILPFNFATAKQPTFDNTTPNGWLTTADKVISPSIENNWTCHDWIVFNKQQTGYYRVNYDNDLWQLIIDALTTNHSIIHRVNRAQLIDDALNNARTGRLDYEVALRLLQYLDNENDYAPWASVNRNLKFLNVHLEKSANYHLWQRYCLGFIEPVYDRMGLATHPQDSLQQRMAREIVVMWACKLGSLHCRNNTADIIQNIVHNTSLHTDPDLREAIYCNGLRYATSDAFDTFFKRMQNSQDQGYRSELIRSLGCVQDETLLKQFLNTTIATDGFNYYGQERDRVLEAVYSSGYMGMRVAINFFKSHMVQINELYNKGNFGGRAISTAIRRMAKQTASEEIYIELRELMEQLLEIGLLQNSDMLRALEQSNENLVWINTKGQLIELWLHTKYETTTVQTTSSTVSSSIYTSRAEISIADLTTRSSISYSVDPTTQTSTSIVSSTSLRTSVHSSLFPVEEPTTSMPLSLSTENYQGNSRASWCMLSKMLTIALGIVSIILDMRF
ncbi:aminopeptidase N-like [Anopheles ziemanni]|uniref:aminopeptidase N-like n=1 Tax=Anopheles coustani TaxID=139045 RepID=UPI0026589853|nr:aminopeptidase N-like [Anopheles coustani]XP_058169931.1 aminopeptidase N-like [Anopheles ziemanni]